MKFKSNLIAIKGDASFRKFFRKKTKKKSSIIIISKKEKTKNLLIYDSINKLFLKKKINAPKLIAENFNKDFIEVSDLGNHTAFDILKKNKKNIFQIYKKVLIILKKIQKIKTKKIKNFNNKFYKIPNYSKKLLFKETNLFLKWYVPYVLKKNININIKIKKCIISLIKKIKLKNNTFVHRDFHISNLVINKKKISLIDSQDAVFGNAAYDLASLIDDVRIKTSINLKKKIYNHYVYLNRKNINIENFRNDFEILSVLRNLKIIGIFTRLAKRDNKKKYLKMIPYAWSLIELRIKDNNNFKKLKKILDNNFSQKIRKKNRNKNEN